MIPGNKITIIDPFPEYLSYPFQKLHLTLIVNRENRFITQHRIPITLAKMVSHHIRYVSLRFLKK